MMKLKKAASGGRLQNAEDRIDTDPQLRHRQMADRGHRHQDRHLAGLRDTDEAEQDPGLYRRPDQSRRAVLWRGQHVGLDRASRRTPSEVERLAEEGVI